MTLRAPMPDRPRTCANGHTAWLSVCPACRNQGRPDAETDLTLHDPEVCVCAAVQTEEGMVIRGHRHHDCFESARRAFCRPRRDDPDAQGFVTSRGRFVTRREGRRLQEAAGIGSVSPDGYRGDLLYSEDLY